MIKPGRIRIGIDRKVYFECYGLPEPNSNNYGWSSIEMLKYHKAENKYEASKQLIEVSNVCCDIWLPKLYFISKCGTKHTVKNNMPCKAEVTDNKATIIELTKE